MPAKQLHFGTTARGDIQRGIDKLAYAVKITLGPRGRNVVLDKQFGSPLSTKDGVTVARGIELANRFENIGAQMVREVASTTNDVAGDGTTTATVLAQAIYREGHRRCQNRLACHVISLAVVREERSTGYGTAGKASQTQAEHRAAHVQHPRTARRDPSRGTGAGG